MNEIDEKLYSSSKYVEGDFVDKQKYIAKHVFQPIVEKYTENVEHCNQYIKKICELTRDIEVEINGVEKEKIDAIINPKYAVGDLLKITVWPTDTEKVVVYGYTQNSKWDYNGIGKRDTSINIVGLSGFFAGIYLYKKLIKELERLKGLEESERELDYNYQKTIEYFEIPMEQKPEIFKKSPEEARLFCQQMVEDAIAYKKKARPNNRKVSYNIFQTAYNLAKYSHDTFAFGYYTFQRVLRGEIPMHGYFDFVQYSPENNEGWKALNIGFAPFEFYRRLLYCVEETKGNVFANYKRYKDLESDYAKSFMTKKNQSDKLKEKINASRFWKYFGYVEYDEDIDYDAITQYEKEFERFYKKHISKIDLSKNAIRFRRLGQHHAAGLYYPYEKCLCVEIEQPNAFIHELGHLIDYERGNLSVQPDFREICDDTTKHLLECMKQSDQLAKELKSKNKYNLSYYRTPTEVFARCFELYAYYVWGVKNSLLKAEYGGVYDCSEENIRKIKAYFDKIFEN
jgi:hypothetical protein